MDDLRKELKKCECIDRRCGKERRKAGGDMFAGTDRRSHKDRRSGSQRRKHQRFQLEDFTFVNLKSESDKDIGQLIDISNGPNDFSKLDIVLSGSEFAIIGLPFKVVSDTEINNGCQYSPINFRRYCVQFEELTYNQNFRLCYFLSNHPMDRPI